MEKNIRLGHSISQTQSSFLLCVFAICGLLKSGKKYDFVSETDLLIALIIFLLSFIGGFVNCSIHTSLC